jgi:hypothetical protein
MVTVAFKIRNIISVLNQPNLVDASDHPDNDNNVDKDFPPQVAFTKSVEVVQVHLCQRLGRNSCAIE